MSWQLRFLGVGSAAAPDLGSASAVLEHDGAAELMIDCGAEALSAYQQQYGAMPAALFLTHTHYDHIAGLERLFAATWFGGARRGEVRLFVPAPLVPLVQARCADYPGVLAEGGVNWWDAFRLTPVSRGFWHGGRWYDCFPVRHHAPNTAFGLALRGAFVYTGDTRPIPEQLAAVATGGELIAHDCGLHGNPSHTGVDDLLREYPEPLRARMVLYHYSSLADGEAIAARGLRVARRGDAFELGEPAAALEHGANG